MTHLLVAYRNGNRWPHIAGSIVVASFLITGCAKDESAAAAPAGAPSGGDYHSTVVRAKDRAGGATSEANDVRKEQIKEADAFATPAGGK